MKRYDSYKDSGVEWIGEVPSHWEVCKLKHRYYFQTGATPNTGKKENFNGDLKWANISDLNGSIVYETAKHISKGAASKCSMSISPKGSLMYSFKLSVGAVAFCGCDMYTNEAIASFVPQNNNLKFLFYCAPIFIIHNANRNIYNAPLLNQELIKNALICLPPLSEQTSIANYLDKKCSEIDNVISAQQKRIALLQELKQSIITHAVTKGLNPNVEMKDSGMEWIGEVPKHWEICKLKHVSSLYGRIGFRGYNQTDLVADGEGAITLSPSNMQNGTMDYNKCSFLSWKKYYESPEIMIKDGDILFVKTGSTYGKTSLVRELPMEATINPQIVVFKDIKVNNHFLYYLLTNDIVQMQVSLTVGGSTIPTLSQDNISNYVIPVAPKDEQNEIANYLDKKCASIDSSISKAQHQVELLQEYKQSLITEVVTGKRKVC